MCRFTWAISLGGIRIQISTKSAWFGQQHNVSVVWLVLLLDLAGFSSPEEKVLAKVQPYFIPDIYDIYKRTQLSNLDIFQNKARIMVITLKKFEHLYLRSGCTVSCKNIRGCATLFINFRSCCYHEFIRPVSYKQHVCIGATKNILSNELQFVMSELFKTLSQT